MPSSRKKIDTSGMFQSMLGKSEPTEEPKAEKLDPAVPEIIAKPEESDKPENKETTQTLQNEPPAASKKSNDNSSKAQSAAKRAPAKAEKNDPKDAQMVKTTLYISQENWDAIALYKLHEAKSGRVDSKIVNNAISEYLSKELEALASVDKSITGQSRIVEALRLWLQK